MSVLTNGAASRAPKRRKLSQGTDDLAEDGTIQASSGDEQQRMSSHSTGTQRNRPKSRGNATPLIPSGGLNKTSMLSLQIDELLSESRPDFEKLNSRLEKTFQRLRALIAEIPPKPPMLVAEAEKSLRKEAGIIIPFTIPRPGVDTKYKFEFQKPTDITHIGPTASKLAIKGVNTVVLAVSMPESLLQEKDYLNYRALNKRAFYLACIAAGIQNAAPAEFSLQFEYQNDIDLLPSLLVLSTPSSPKGFLKSNCRIRITVTLPTSSIPVERTTPNKNCVRSASTGVGNASRSTPFYNSCIRYIASTSTSQQGLLQNALQTCEAFADTCRLARIWLQQRGIGPDFGPQEWDLLCALLLKTGGHKGQPLLSNRYSTVQLFKAVLQFLVAKDLTTPLIVRSDITRLPVSTYPLLYDGVTGVNLFFRMTPWSYQALREEASISLSAINSRNEDNFEAVFIARAADSILKFDELYHINCTGFKNGAFLSQDWSEISNEIFNLVSRGLGDRAKSISIITATPAPWAIDKPAPKRGSRSDSLEVGLFLAPDNIQRLIDHGPSAEDQAAAADFRSFWGEKSELRRFKDGSISESLVWAEDSPVTLQIIQYLVQAHLELPNISVTMLGNQVDRLLQVEDSKLQPADAFKLLNNAYQSLTTQLHHLDELPLRIRSIHPADSQLSSSSLIYPLTTVTLAPAAIFIEFENSTRWPDSLPAIQNTKIAFLLKLGEALQSAHPELSTRVGLENTSASSSGHLNTSFLDVIYPPASSGLSSIAFRVRIRHDRELTLLENSLASKTHSPPVQASLTAALQSHKRDSLALPRHTAALRTLTTRFPALSQTIRILKKWTSSHNLPPSLLSDAVLDLLAIHSFTHPAPWSTPSTPQTAFLRTLHTIARWDWASEPLMVDTSLDASLFSSATDVEALRTRFKAWRKLDPSMNNVVLFIGTNLDPTGVMWTQGQQPPRVVAARLNALAKASIKAVRAKGIKMQTQDWAGLFQSPLSDFDFLIHLKRGFGRGESKRGGDKTKFKNLVVQEEMDAELIGYDPVKVFAGELQETFGHNILWFYDIDGGKTIAGLWNPRILRQKDWRVRLEVSSVPVVALDEYAAEATSKKQVVVNQAGILAEIGMLGAGLVQKIEVVKDLVL